MTHRPLVPVPALDPAVADGLDAQNARLAPSPRRDAHLRALRRGAAAVVTGQQVGLFLGPLFTIYKAATAVRLARVLEAERGEPVVPVFWLQTEDHDLAEIAWCGLPGHTLRVPVDADNKVSIAHLSLPPEVAACVDALDGAHAARVARHYRPGVPWGAAFAGLLSELFADEGLVFLDPRDRAFAGVAREVHRRALVDAESLAAALARHTAILAGHTVHVRPRAPLSFYHPDGAAGPRVRVDRCEPALLAALDEDPLRFSTSALLRPMLQDSLLSTAAYVGGPAEVAYLRQLPPLYQAYGLPMPRVVTRARFRVVEPWTARALERLGLACADVEAPEDEVLARCARAAPAGEAVARRLLEGFEGAMGAVAPEVAGAGPHLARELAKVHASLGRSVGKLAAKLDRATRRRDRETVETVRRLRDFLYPTGAPQERVLGLPAVAARAGDRGFVEKVLGAIVPGDATLRDLAT